MKLFFCMLSMLSVYIYPKEFKTLKEFTEYAQAMPEYPDNDTDDWNNPEYVVFHKQMIPSFKKRIIHWLRMQSSTVFSVDLLAPVLKEVSDYLQKTVPEGRLIKKVSVDSGAVFYIWGELNGAFHSLVRALNELRNQGIIDNDLKILQPMAHFVFAGDVANKSPYLIETIFLILRLMQANPQCEGRSHEKVFYLKGKQEDRQEWLNGGLGKELRDRLVPDAAEKTPLTSAFSNFFNRLPLALYLLQEGRTGKKVEAVRISYFGPEYSELEESGFLYFFDDYSRPVISLSQRAFLESDISLKIRAYIYAGSDLNKQMRQSGLAMLSKKENNTEWTVFSSPTGSSRRLYQFFDDAFVRLDVKEELSKWTMTLFHQDVRSQSGFVQDAPVYLLSGEAIKDLRQQKVVELQKELVTLINENQSLKKNCVLAQADETVKEPAPEKKPDQAISALQNGNFVIGSTMDLSKQFKTYNETLKAGLNLAIDTLNKEGGIRGKKIRMVYLDDAYEPSIAKANIEKLLQDFKTNVTLSSMGSPTIAGYLDLIKDGKIFVIFPNTGAFRSPDLKYLIHLRTSYLENGHMIAQFVVNDLKDKKIAFFYQDDAWGKNLYAGAKYEFEKAGITQFLDLPYMPNSISFTQQSEALKKFNPDAIALFCNPKVCQEFFKEVGAEYLRGKLLFGDTVLGLNDFSAYLKEKGLNMVRLQVVPDPIQSQLEIVKEFREAANKAGAPIDIISLEGYMNAAVFLDIVQKIKGDITIDNFIKAVEEIKDYDFKGLKLNFDPKTRQLLHTVWFNTGESDWPSKDVVVDELADDTQDKSVEKGADDKVLTLESVQKVKTSADQKVLEVQKRAQERLSSEDSKLTSLQGKTLKIGSTMDLSKGVKGLSDGYKGGMMLKLDEINASGGTNGIVFQLNVMDDKYEPSRAQANVLEMMNELHIDLLLAPLGTPTTKAYLDVIEQGKVLALFPIARSAEFRRPDLINIIQYQMSLKQEAEIITRYVYENFKVKKLVVFYQNDDFGIEPKNEIERLAKTDLTGLELLAVPYERNNVSFKEQVAKIKNFKPDAIALQATSSVIEELVRQTGADFLYGKILFGGSWLMVDQFLKSMKEKGLDVNLISSVPDPENSDIELAQEYRKAAQAKNVPLNVIYFEGYLYMSLLEHAMKAIDEPYSKEKIINVFQNMKNFDFKGLKLNFNPETRVILQNAWIYSTKANVWIQRTIDKAKDRAPSS